jgi:hypothetical protein
VTDSVAGHDLKAMVEAGLLEPRGEKRGRFYVASPTIMAIRKNVAEPKNVPDPFAESAQERNAEAPLLPGMEHLTD